MSIKAFINKLKEYNIWGLLAATCLLGIVLILVILVLVLVFSIPISDEFLSVLEWFTFILVIGFIVSYSLKDVAIINAINRSKGRNDIERKKKDSDFLVKKQELYEREKEILEWQKVVNDMEISYRRLNEAYNNNQIEDCMRLRDEILEAHELCTKVREAYENKWEMTGKE